MSATLTARLCDCIGCGRLFVGVTTFEKHRLGAIGVDRRCATDDELRERGLAQDEQGAWVDERGRAKAAPALERLRAKQAAGRLTQAQGAPKAGGVARDATDGVEAPTGEKVARAA